MNDSHADNYICEDVLINILARLPAKSLVRFLCVSKSWSNLIRSSSFVAAHLNRNVTDYNQYLLAKHFYRVSKGSYLISLFANETFEQCLELQHPLWTNKHFEVYSSCNGLVCISDKDLSSTSPICIWNPFIRKSISVPNTYMADHIGFKEISLSLCFDSNHNDYKVVKMLRICQERSMEVEVYSLVTNSWKMIESTPLLDSLWWVMAHEVCKGIVYWLIYERHHRIVSFDTGSEIFDELLVPDSILPINGFVKIQAYKETICLLQGDTNIDFWVLQEGSFQKLRTIILPGYSPFGLFTDNGLLVQKDSTHTELDLFDLESNQLKDTRILTCDRYKLHAYKGSLVLFDH